MFSKGGRGKSCVSSRPPYLQGARRSFALHTGPRSQPHKVLFGVCQRRGSVCSCSSGCLVPGSPWQPRCVPGQRFCLRATASISMRAARSGGGAVSPHDGKIMAVLVFMGRSITSVGGSVVAVGF